MKVGDLVKFDRAHQPTGAATTEVRRMGIIASMRLMNPEDTEDYLVRVTGFDYEIWDHDLEVVSESR